MELSDKAWKIAEPLLPELPTDKPGRPWRENREVLDALLWVFGWGHRGVIYRSSIHRIKRAIRVSSNGLLMGRWKMCSKRYQVRFTNGVN